MSNFIITPLLPPMDGCIEIEANGVRQYQKIVTEQEQNFASLAQDNEALRTQVLTLTDTLDTVLSVILPALMG